VPFGLYAIKRDVIDETASAASRVGVPVLSESPGVQPAIAALNLTRRFGHRVVVRDVTLEVRGGETVLLVGHNGAGKTTLIRLLAGLLKPTAGTIECSGTLGVVAHNSMLYDALTARENLAFYARLYGVDSATRVDELLQRMGLAPHGDRRVAAYSRGMVQRLAIARALLPDPTALLLDEPLTGLDEAAATIVREVLSDLRTRGCAVIIATHQLVEIADLASAVGFLVSGRLAAMEPIGGRDAAAVMARYRELARDG
jgi:heme exporter protein A